MFTFGRVREKESAARLVMNPDQTRLIEAVVDAVHDALEGTAGIDSFRPAVSQAFLQGGVGVWEQAGSWLRRMTVGHPQLQSLWIELAAHPEWKVRYRVACFLNELSPPLVAELGSCLIADSNAKVRGMAEARMQEIGH